ncbi:putative membrane protein [Rivularia sp. PCC 7116]|uniref:manganese efflux pump MntP n=1 Tax=Rivularia sp. PCC 7116 TaxID=373994 RepID=UPI00029ED77A|nr:manganese efflux pump MntP family protein [Rivularia sp. PCC 7116]AFY58542.1 putative membrane protein [Rivularia sp. PCC 7116]
MELSSSILLAFGLAADACAVSLSSGLTIRHIKMYKAIKIALFFGIFQAIMPLIGWLAGLSIRSFVLRFNHWIIFGILVYLGGKMIFESFADSNNDEKPKFNCLEIYTLIALSIATSIDAFAAGLGLSILKSSILLTATVIGFITFTLSFIAVYIGHFCGDMFKQKVEVIGGGSLIFLGTKILIEAFV